MIPSSLSSSFQSLISQSSSLMDAAASSVAPGFGMNLLGAAMDMTMANVEVSAATNLEATSQAMTQSLLNILA